MHGIEASGELQVAVSMRFRLPAEPLRDLITSYYVVEASGPPRAAVTDLLHPEWGNLRLQLRNEWQAFDEGGLSVPAQPAALFGPTSKARMVVARPGAVQGVGFTPLGWTLLVGCPADQMADAVIPAEQAWGPTVLNLQQRVCAADTDDARVQLLDTFFSARITTDRHREPLVRAIHAAMLDPSVQTVDEFARRSGVSAPALGRACLRYFGFTPKILLRRQRFLRTLASLSVNEGEPIGDFIDAAYVDHSHFNREFKRFMGLSPSEYLAQPRLILKAATGQRDLALGAALQGLHAIARTP